MLEGLREYERAVGTSPEVREARVRSCEYLLECSLMRRRSTVELIKRDRKGGANWTRFAFPTWWHYDVLRGLDFLRYAGVAPDERVAEAIELVASRCGSDRRWRLETRHPGVIRVELGEDPGEPSRWITLRALRVLWWYSAGVQHQRRWRRADFG